MYIVYLGSDKIRIVEASTRFGKIIVNSLFSAVTPNDYLDNPNDKTFSEFSNVIAQGLVEMKGKGKKVKVILENNTIPFIEKEIPTLKSDIKIINIIKNEIFSDEKLSRSNILDYVESDKFVKVDKIKIQKNEKWEEFLGKKSAQNKKAKASKENKDDDKTYKEVKVKTTKLFFTYIAKVTVQHLEKFFKDLGYKLTSIDIYQNAMRKMITNRIELDKKSKQENSIPHTFILAEYKDDAITIILFKDGKFAYTFRKAVMLSISDMNSNSFAFVSELADTIKEALQFFRAKYQDIEFSGIYLTGSLLGFEHWKDIIASRVAYNIDILPKPKNILNVDELEFNEFSGALAGYAKV